MSQTPNSSLTAYVTVNEFIARKDVRTLGQLATDNGTQLTPSQLQTNTRVLAAINDASGYVESYLVASERYLPTDLQALISQGGMSGEFLKRIICNLAFYYMFGGRDAPMPPETVTADYQAAMKDLESLGNGTLVLSFLQSEQAGVASNEYMTMEQIRNLNQFTDNCQRVMGIRNYLRRGY